MFWVFLLICIVAWIVVSIVKEVKPVSPEAIAKMQQEEIELANRMREGTKKKEEYFNWLNENYSISKIFDYKNHYFKYASGLRNRYCYTGRNCKHAENSAKRGVMYRK